MAATSQTPAPALPTMRHEGTMRPDERRRIAISWVVLAFAALLSLFPTLWVVTTSLNTGNSFATGLLPDHYTFSHYLDVLQHTDFLIWLRNTFFVGVVTGVIQVMIVTLLAYAFSRFHFVGRRYGLVILLAMQLFPTVMALSAQYYLVNWITEHWFPISDNWIGLIAIYAGTSVPYMAWLYKGYIDTLPYDLEESAYIDGASRWQAFWRVILPLCRPMMAVTFITGFLGVANEYILVSVLVTDPTRKTFSMGLFDFATGQFETNWTNFAAAAVMGSIPFILLFVSTQRWLVSGLAGGAVKG